MRYAWIRCETSQVIVTAPGSIASVIVVPDGDDDRARVILYNGESTTDPRILMIRTLPGECKVVDFSKPVLFDRGLYITFDSHVEEVLIQVQWGVE